MDRTVKDTVDQAISDFDEIEAAIEENGVEIPILTPTKDYDDYINMIPTVVSPRKIIEGMASEEIKRNNLVQIDVAGKEDGCRAVGNFFLEMIPRCYMTNNKNFVNGPDAMEKTTPVNAVQLNDDLVFKIYNDSFSYAGYAMYNRKTNFMEAMCINHYCTIDDSPGNNNGIKDAINSTRNIFKERWCDETCTGIPVNITGSNEYAVFKNTKGEVYLYRSYFNSQSRQVNNVWRVYSVTIGLYLWKWDESKQKFTQPQNNYKSITLTKHYDWDGYESLNYGSGRFAYVMDDRKECTKKLVVIATQSTLTYDATNPEADLYYYPRTYEEDNVRYESIQAGCFIEFDTDTLEFETHWSNILCVPSSGLTLNGYSYLEGGHPYTVGYGSVTFQDNPSRSYYQQCYMDLTDYTLKIYGPMTNTNWDGNIIYPFKFDQDNYKYSYGGTVYNIDGEYVYTFGFYNDNNKYPDYNTHFIIAKVNLKSLINKFVNNQEVSDYYEIIYDYLWDYGAGYNDVRYSETFLRSDGILEIYMNRWTSYTLYIEFNTKTKEVVRNQTIVQVSQGQHQWRPFKFYSTDDCITFDVMTYGYNYNSLKEQFPVRETQEEYIGDIKEVQDVYSHTINNPKLGIVDEKEYYNRKYITKETIPIKLVHNLKDAEHIGTAIDSALKGDTVPVKVWTEMDN